MRALGGVAPFPTAEIGGAGADSLWTLWTGGHRHHAAFQTARGALRALLRAEGVPRLWLPAYICAETAAAAPPGCEVRFYAHGPGLPLDALTPASGDAVLCVDYFGRSAPEPAARLARERRDVLWIEDRAQAMAPDAEPWGDVLLYSPRKLVGVADGGLLVSDRALPPSPAPVADPSAWTAAIARLGDVDGAHPERWRPSFLAREAGFAPDAAPMDALTRALLERIDARPLIARRRSNYAHLLQRLGDYALWPDVVPGFAPLAFPVRVRDAAAAVAAMAERRIFCPRYWAALPSPAEAFAGAHALAAELLCLPCDHRYDDADMDRAAKAIRALAEPARHQDLRSVGTQPR